MIPFCLMLKLLLTIPIPLLSLSPLKRNFSCREGGDSLTPHRSWCTCNQQSSSAWKLFHGQAKGLDPEQSLKVALNLPPPFKCSPISRSAASLSLCEALRPRPGWEVKTHSQQSWGSVSHLCSDLWSSIPCALWEGE